LLKQHPFQMF